MAGSSSEHRFLTGGWRALGLAGMVLLAACTSMQPPILVTQEQFTARLSGDQALPPASGAGQGEAELRYEARTGQVHWRVTHSGLSGPVVAAHIHGPAGPGQEAPPLIPLGGGNRLELPLEGRMRITPEQLNQLDSGQWYVDLHTALHPAGELRGQLRPRSD